MCKRVEAFGRRVGSTDLSSTSSQTRQTPRCEKAVEAIGFCGPDENSKMHGHGRDECKTLAELDTKRHPDEVADAQKKQVELSLWSIVPYAPTNSPLPTLSRALTSFGDL